MLYTFGAEKGGVGKSTLAEEMAVERASRGFETLLVDLDPQRTTTEWAAARVYNEVVPQIVCVSKGKSLTKELIKMREAFDTVIVDIGGKDTRDLREAIVIADKTIVPIKPSPADLRTFPDFADFIRRINAEIETPKDVCVVLNMVNGSSNQFKRFTDGFAEFSDCMKLLDSRVCERVAYQNAYEAGKGVRELSRSEYDPKAAAEIESLYLEIFGNE